MIHSSATVALVLLLLAAAPQPLKAAEPRVLRSGSQQRQQSSSIIVQSLDDIADADDPSSSEESEESSTRTVLSAVVATKNEGQGGNETEEAEGQIWAVLVAGSRGWYNYRHQADICHAYHILRAHGVPASNIITLMVDDIARSKENPYPGKIFNNPTGSDVYAGVKIDYKGKHVTPENFVAVLLGDERGVKGGTGRVLKSTKKDKVFVNFADHGATGLIAFPIDMMSVQTLKQTLQMMHTKGMYGELVFYLEACESGSMFEGQLARGMNIFAVTAANPDESSWGCYCDTEFLPVICLGDVFSVNWMEDSDKEDLRSETLERQYLLVKTETNTSHVSQYGNMGISDEDVSEFQGTGQSLRLPWAIPQQARPSDHKFYTSRDVPLLSLSAQYQRETNRWRKARLGWRMHQLMEKRSYLDQQMASLVAKVVHDPVTRIRVFHQRPVVPLTRLACHHHVTHAFHKWCFNFGTSSYALKYVYVLANLCELRLPAERIVAIIADHCGSPVTGVGEAVSRVTNII